MSGPFSFFDGIYCICCDRSPELWAQAVGQFKALGIADRVQRYSTAEHDRKLGFGEMPRGPQRAWAGTTCHVAIIEEAKKRGLENVLIFEDDVKFLEPAKVLSAALK